MNNRPSTVSPISKEGRVDLSNGKDKIEIVGDQPGMIYVAVEAGFP